MATNGAGRKIGLTDDERAAIRTEWQENECRCPLCGEPGQLKFYGGRCRTTAALVDHGHPVHWYGSAYTSGPTCTLVKYPANPYWTEDRHFTNNVPHIVT